jgi:hypothetical protein
MLKIHHVFHKLMIGSGSWPFFTAALLVAHSTIVINAFAAGNGPEKDASRMLLGSIRQEIAVNTNVFKATPRTDALLTKFSILEYQSDAQDALGRVRAMQDPFFASLALGGIAAIEMSADPSASTNHFREALSNTSNITHWTGSHATSLEFLFSLLSSYPKKDASLLLTASQKAFDAWKGSADQKGSALLALSKATTVIAPDRAEELLLDVALKSNHHWDSIEYLGTFMARQSLEKTLKLAEQHYQARKDWPNDQYFLRAVLIELARTDFDRSFQSIKKMRDLDQEIAAEKLAESMLAENRKKDAREVINYLDALKTEFAWTKESLDKLHSQLEQEGENITQADTATPKQIDDFLKDANATQLQSLAGKASITFKDKQQVSDFVAKALPLAESIADMGYPHHGSPRSAALGLLVLCSVLTGESDKALEISRRIAIPELRISYLLDAYEQINPLPAPVPDWPIHFWKRTSVSLQ